MVIVDRIRSPMKYLYKVITSPVGKLKLVASDKGLAAILWENDHPGRVKFGELELSHDHPILLETELQLNQYFLGERKSFSLKLDLIGTRFQSEVWKALLDIPFGETRSYAEIARQLGNARATRAVGAANGRNP